MGGSATLTMRFEGKQKERSTFVILPSVYVIEEKSCTQRDKDEAIADLLLKK